MRKAYLYTDGASFGNPGASGIGVILTDESGKTLVELSEPIGIATNNEAEYRALLRGLEEALRHGVQHLVWYTDSELLVRQWRGEYAVRSPNLQGLYKQARELAKGFACLEVHHQARETNRAADRLAKQAARRAKQ